MQAEARFDAMGSCAHVLVVGPDAATHLDFARLRVAELEARWTRFSPDSEVSRLNDNAGQPMLVSSDTYRLIEHAVAAWELTNGRYDPTLLHHLAALGYDRTFAAVGRSAPVIESLPSRRSVGAIDLNPGLQAVRLPPGVGIDPGGIGKGFAADLLVEELLGRGAGGVMVNLGGDVRAAGAPPEGATGWSISVADPFDLDRELLRVEIAGGAVATSSRLLRQWSDSEGRTLHHLLDAATGRPIDNGVAAVTVIAAEAWWAEALTKAVFGAGVIDGLAQLLNASGVIVDVDGARHATPDLQEALR